MPSIYSLKPKFQALLRPVTQLLANSGVTANQVTLTACVLSIALGLFLTFLTPSLRYFLLLPAFLFLRMALNAIDGMLAREHGQRSHLGAYLNELTDVISDAFLYMPFAYLPGFPALWVGAIIVFGVISEMAGVVAQTTGASRRYDGPMGKSDRAFLFGALGLFVGAGGNIPRQFSSSLLIVITLLLVLTIFNRVRAGLAELKKK